jgi:hypothetical protein
VAAGERRPRERRHPPGQAAEGRGDHLVVVALGTYFRPLPSW